MHAPMEQSGVRLRDGRGGDIQLLASGCDLGFKSLSLCHPSFCCRLTRLGSCMQRLRFSQLRGGLEMRLHAVRAHCEIFECTSSSSDWAHDPWHVLCETAWC